MTDLLGPADAPFSVTVRPADSRVFGSLDTFFKDCTNTQSQDGTKLQAGFTNGLLQQVRHLIRGAGVTEDNTDDDMVLKAVRALVLAQLNLGVRWRGAASFTSSGSFDPAAHGLTAADKILILVWGAGAGSSPDAGGASNGAAGSGGGFALKIASAPASATAVTIGAGGLGHTGGTSGGAGGTTSFGAIVSATGAASTTAGAGSPGAGSGGDINLQGALGGDMATDGSRVWAQGGAAPLMGGAALSGSGGGAQAGPPGSGGACGVGIAFDGSPGLCIVIW